MRVLAEIIASDVSLLVTFNQAIENVIRQRSLFRMPTQITSNRIHERVQPFVNGICNDVEPVRLAHSASWLVDTVQLRRLHASSPELLSG